MASAAHPIAFTIGSRRLFAIERQLVTVSFSLEDILLERPPAVPTLGSADGLRVLSAPPAAEERLHAAMPGFVVGARQDYARSYIAMTGSYEDYLAQFSGKTRSTLRRKRRKLEEAGGGALDVRCYRTPEELDEFLALALPLSRKTYQSRLLDAGLPEGEAAQRAMRELADRDDMRAFLLFLAGEPIAYLYLPVSGRTLIYAYLGYDAEHAHLSPGTVLQMAALENLFAEKRFAFFDFTEGEGAHKALFGTGSIRCASYIMLRPSGSNRALLRSLEMFDRGVAATRNLASRFGLDAAIRRRLR